MGTFFVKKMWGAGVLGVFIGGLAKIGWELGVQLNPVKIELHSCSFVFPI